MSYLWLDSKDLASIIDHAEHAYPQECCGLLVGKIQGDRIMAIEVYPMANQWDQGGQWGQWDQGNQGDQATVQDFEAERPTAERRYTIDPRAILEVQKLARDRGLAIVGIYHSHPEHPAIPSEYDREFAWAEYVYPIVSVSRGSPSTVRAWRLDDDRQFYELELRDSEGKF